MRHLRRPRGVGYWWKLQFRANSAVSSRPGRSNSTRRLVTVRPVWRPYSNRTQRRLDWSETRPVEPATW